LSGTNETQIQAHAMRAEAHTDAAMAVPDPQAARSQHRRTLVLGLGNPVRTDDAVGLHVVQQLGPALADRPDVDVAEDYWGGLRLMERLVGFDRAIIVDAQRTGAPPGTVSVLSADSGAPRHVHSSHDVGLLAALEFGRHAGAHLPAAGHILLVGIEAADVETFGTRCTAAVADAVPRAVEQVLSLLTEWR